MCKKYSRSYLPRAFLWIVICLLFVIGSVIPVRADEEVTEIIFVGDQRTRDMHDEAAKDVSSVTGESDASQHQWIYCDSASGFKGAAGSVTAAIGADGHGKAVVICCGVNDATDTSAADVYCWPRTKYMVEVPVLDENGNQVYVEDADGNLVAQYTTEERENHDGFQDTVAEWTSRGAKVYWASITPVREGNTSPSEAQVKAFNSALKGKLPSGVSWLEIYDLVANSNPYFRTGVRYDEATSAEIFHIIWNTILLQNPEKEVEPIDTSMYSVSCSLTAYVNSVLGPSASEDHADHVLSEANGTFANAGAFLGFGDEEYDFTPFITTMLSKSSSTTSYEALLDIEGGSNSMYVYCRYGTLLADLGLDQYGSEAAYGSEHWFPGLIMYVLYFICSSVSLIFSFVLQLLTWLNPFQFLANASSISQEMKDAMTGANLEQGEGVGIDTTFIQPMIAFMGNVYDSISHIAWWAVIPIMFALLVASLLLWSTTKRSSMQHAHQKQRNVWMFVIRVAFIAVGVPLIGSFYTLALSWMTDLVSNAKSAPTQMVAATFLDFESWAKNLRLEPQDGTVLVSEGDPDEPGGKASDESVKALRNTAFALNQASGVMGDVGAFGSGTMSNVLQWNTEALTEDDMSSMDARRQVLSVLQRYMDGAFYYPSSWESDVGNALNQYHSDDMGRQPSEDEEDPPDNENTVYEMFDETTEFDDWDGRSSEENKEIFTYGSKWTGSSGNFNIFSNGEIGGAETSATPSDTITYEPGRGLTGNGADPGLRGGLSTMSMYNYLSSKFTNNSVITYSAQLAPSQYTRESHYSVNLIGSGVLHILYFANCAVLLLVVAILGLGYAFGMIFSNIKRSLHVLVTIPTAMLCVLKSIVTFITTVVMMIMELVGTMFLYVLISDLLMVFVSALESPLSNLTTSGSVEASIVGGVFGAIGASAATLSSSLYPLYANLMVTTLVLFVGAIAAVVWCPAFLWLYHNVMQRIWMKFVVPMELQEVWQREDRMKEPVWQVPSVSVE